MNKNEIIKIINKMSAMKGFELRQIARPGSMMSLEFGEKNTADRNDNRKSEIKDTDGSKYAVHVDGFFRITHKGRIALSKDDMFRPSSLIQNDTLDEVDFDWDIAGNNKFDEEKNKFEDIDLVIQEIYVNEYGDLRIILSDDYSIEVFIDTNEDEECWRFFEVGNNEKPHIVVTGCGYSEE